MTISKKVPNKTARIIMFWQFKSLILCVTQLACFITQLAVSIKQLDGFYHTVSGQHYAMNIQHHATRKGGSEHENYGKNHGTVRQQL